MTKPAASRSDRSRNERVRDERATTLAQERMNNAITPPDIDGAVGKSFVVRPVQDRLVKHLRERILKADDGFEPGRRLSVKAIAADLGVSPTPIIQALQKLGVEGIVTYKPRYGVYVTDLSEKEIEELADLRCGLEILALTIQRKTPIEEIVHNVLPHLDRGQEMIAANNIAEYWDCDYRFHLSLVEASKNNMLVSFYHRIWDQAQLGHAYAPRAIEDITASFQQHSVLANSIAAGGDSAVQAALIEHWYWSKQRMLYLHRTYLHGRG